MDEYTDGCPQDNSSTQQIEFDLRGVKIEDNAESHTGEKISSKCMTHDYTSEH